MTALENLMFYLLGFCIGFMISACFKKYFNKKDCNACWSDMYERAWTLSLDGQDIKVVPIYECNGGQDMSIMLGNLTVEQIEERLNIKFTEEHKKELRETWQQKAENIKPGKWHFFDIPLVMACGDKETAQKMCAIFKSYDLSHTPQFGVSWTGSGANG